MKQIQPYIFVILAFITNTGALLVADVKICNRSTAVFDFRIKKSGGVICLDWKPLPAGAPNSTTGNCKIVQMVSKDCIGTNSPAEVSIEIDSRTQGKCTFESVKNSIQSKAVVITGPNDYIACKIEK